MFFQRVARRYKELRRLRIIRSCEGNGLLGFSFGSDDLRLVVFGEKPKFIPIDYMKKRYNINQTTIRQKLQRINDAVGEKPINPVVWSYFDKNEFGVNLDDHFSNLIRLEVGLLNGTSPHRKTESVILSRGGMYFDGRSTNDLEQGLNKLQINYASSNGLAEAVVSKALDLRVTKYNFPMAVEASIPKDALLVIGQKTGDQAIESTNTVCSNNKSFIEFLHKDAPVSNVSKIYYKPHPKNRANETEIDQIRELRPTVNIIPATVNILPFLERRPRVATLTSGAGLEAALRNCEVHCFGTSFYSNWGFTNDYIECSRRNNTLTAADVFAYVLINQTRYIDIVDRRRISVEEAFDLQNVCNW